MDMTNYQYDIYNQIGEKINQVKFADIIQKFGEPIATSSDGQHFVLKKEEKVGDKINMTFSLFTMNIFGMTEIKRINLLEQVQKKKKDI